MRISKCVPKVICQCTSYRSCVLCGPNIVVLSKTSNHATRIKKVDDQLNFRIIKLCFVLDELVHELKGLDFEDIHEYFVLFPI